MNRDRLRLILEKVYDSTPPWDSPSPPKQLVDMIESETLSPCCSIDVGCGLGQNSLYLASQGFSVLGIDFSENAIQMAQDNAARSGKSCRFCLCDALEIEDRIQEAFGFCLEWGLLHFIMPTERSSYICQLAGVLSPGALYLTLCFNEQSCEWGGAGKKLRTSPLTGAECYYSSVDELEKLYQPHFTVVSKDVVSMRFAGSPTIEHLENLFLLKRK